MEIIYKESKRSKNVRIKINFAGKVEVVYPAKFLLGGKKAARLYAQKFVAQKSDWIEKQLAKISRKNINPVLEIDSREHFLIHKEQALDFVTERVEFWNEKYGFKYNEIRVKKIKSNWGTCSSRKVLTFNYKILFLAPHVADYIVVHELCHLQEMNHSVRFWDLVKKEVPDARELHKNIGALD